MYWGGIPLLLAYAGYSLLYDVHKSWYSYIVTTLVGFVYFWGFLMMVIPCIFLLIVGPRALYQLSTPLSGPHAPSYHGLQMYPLSDRN
jgi:hypothetical protein